MNVFWFELQKMIRSHLGWLLGGGALIAIYISVYPSFSEDAAATKKIFASLPPAVHAAIGFDPDVMFSFLGFLANIFTVILLFASIHGAIIGLGLLSRETRSGTTDFLLAKPRQRGRIYFAKLTAGLIICLDMSLWIILATFVMAKLVGVGEFSLRTFLLITSTFAFINLWFLAVGIALSQLKPKLKSTVPTGLAIGFGVFLVGTVGSLIDAAKTRWIAPEKYFDFIYILENGSYELRYVAVGIVIIALSLIVGYHIYTKKDIPSPS